MYTFILLICCSGFFCLYNTSKRARLTTGGQIERWLQSHLPQARVLGLGAVLFTIISLVLMDGAFMGILNLLLMLMAAGCYIVALVPFRLLKLGHMLSLGLIAFLFELLIF